MSKNKKYDAFLSHNNQDIALVEQIAIWLRDEAGLNVWPERLRMQIEEYNILDSSNWQDAKEFNNKFELLIKGLNLFYKKSAATTFTASSNGRAKVTSASWR